MGDETTTLTSTMEALPIMVERLSKRTDLTDMQPAFLEEGEVDERTPIPVYTSSQRVLDERAAATSRGAGTEHSSSPPPLIADRSSPLWVRSGALPQPKVQSLYSKLC